jgi:hypothetical protein
MKCPRQILQALQSNSRNIFFIIFIALTTRIIFSLLFLEFKTDYYWEYGEIGKNILSGRGYSLFYFENEILAHKYNPEYIPFPSAYMPPGYVLFLLPFLSISGVVLRNTLLIASQITIACLTIFLLYRFTMIHFSCRAALLAGLSAALFPDFIYSAISYSPTVIYQCLVILLMNFLYHNAMDQNHKEYIVVAFLLLILTFMRFEFILFVFFFGGIEIFNHRWKRTCILISLFTLLLSPWVLRNYFSLGHIIPTGTGFGLNFYRGNNDDELGGWGTVQLKKELLSLPRKKSFEYNLNTLYSTYAFNYISSHPKEWTQKLPLKMSQVWITNNLQEKRNNVLLKILSLIFFLFSSLGILTTLSWKKHKYLYLFLIFSTLIGVLFFTLPRHQTMMRIGLIPFLGSGLEYFWLSLKSKLNHTKKNIETRL